MKQFLFNMIKELQFQSPFRKYFFPRYEYNFHPSQLCFICKCVSETKDVPGDIAEIGCASGSTTIFLNKLLDEFNIKKKYYAIDTFSGFTKSDIAFEVKNRGKSINFYKGFRTNKKIWFDATMETNGIERVLSIKTDVNFFDLTTLAPLSAALLDLDLYQPMKKSLMELFMALSPGGIMVVDDCDPSNGRFDGAYQAYKEFMVSIGRKEEIVHKKLGIVRK